MGGYNSGVWNSFVWGAPGGATPVTQRTAGDLIYSAYRIIQRLAAPGRGYSSEDLKDGLMCLNDMIDSWNVENLAVFVRLRNAYNLTINKQVYTIGNKTVGAGLGLAAPDFDTSPDARPDSIPAASVVINITGNPTEVPIEPLTWEQWQNLPVKQLTSTYPIKFWYDYQYPYGNINLWPTPTQVNQLVLYIKQLLKSAFQNATDAVILPQGYVRALEYNLAGELAVRFPNTVWTPKHETIAVESKANVKRANMRILDASQDASLAPRGGYFSFWTGYYQP